MGYHKPHHVKNDFFKKIRSADFFPRVKVISDTHETPKTTEKHGRIQSTTYRPWTEIVEANGTIKIEIGWSKKILSFFRILGCHGYTPYEKLSKPKIFFYNA